MSDVSGVGCELTGVSKTSLKGQNGRVCSAIQPCLKTNPVTVFVASFVLLDPLSAAPKNDFTHSGFEVLINEM